MQMIEKRFFSRFQARVHLNSCRCAKLFQSSFVTEKERAYKVILKFFCIPEIELVCVNLHSISVISVTRFRIVILAGYFSFNYEEAN